MESKKERQKISFKDTFTASASTLNISPYSSKKESKFGSAAKLKLFKDNHMPGSVKYKIAQLEEREKKTASDTFKAELQKGIGKGNAKTNVGIAKKKANATNLSAANLDLVDLDNPRMLARQIASWKLARNLNIRVLSNEKYGLDESENILGISAMLPETAKSLSEVMKEQKKLMKAANLNPTQMENHLGNTIFSGSIQKQLSDLQIIDALVGQTDRHHGNIFIDIENQRIYGIDNDQAFGANPLSYNAYNAVASFDVATKIRDTDMGRQLGMRDYDAVRGFKFTQNQIDAYTAKKIMALSESDLEKILRDRVGEEYGEYLLPEEINLTKARLRAMKQQILKLKKANKLIKNWDHTTYNESLNLYGAPVDIFEGSYESNSSFSGMQGNGRKYQSYVAREVKKYAHKKSQWGN